MIVVPDHIRGLVFDLDGTIAHTMPLHYKAWLRALGEHGVDFPEALFYEFGGMPTDVIIATLNERHGYTMPVQETAHRKEEWFEELIPQATPIEPVINVIKQNIGRLPMAVATGGFRRIAEKTLAAMGVRQHLQAVVCAEDVTNGKPAPDIFLKAASLIGIAPTDCMAFEDANLGIQAATAAGMLVFDVRTLPPKP